jgi:hypothetical protein
MNPKNMRKGLSSLDGVIREIFMDLESSNFVASLLRNMGVPGVVISPKGGAMPAPEDVEATKTWFQEAFGGDRRGGPLVMGAPTDVTPYGFNPQQMNMSEARDVAEERVCACIGIPAAVVGFGAGLADRQGRRDDGGAVQDRLAQRRAAAHPGACRRAQALAAAGLRRCRPGSRSSGTPTTCSRSGGRGQAGRALEQAKLDSGGITVFEYRQGLGMDADDSHKIYLRRSRSSKCRRCDRPPSPRRRPRKGKRPARRRSSSSARTPMRDARAAAKRAPGGV